MAGGDGRGPNGAGPMTGKGMGYCVGQAPYAGEQPLGRAAGRESGSGALLQGAVIKLIGLAAMAIPALLKARKQLQAPQNRVLFEKDSTGQPVIEIKPVHVEELEEHN